MMSEIPDPDEMIRETVELFRAEWFGLPLATADDEPLLWSPAELLEQLIIEPIVHSSATEPTSLGGPEWRRWLVYCGAMGIAWDDRECMRLDNFGRLDTARRLPPPADPVAEGVRADVDIFYSADTGRLYSTNEPDSILAYVHLRFRFRDVSFSELACAPVAPHDRIPTSPQVVLAAGSQTVANVALAWRGTEPCNISWAVPIVAQDKETTMTPTNVTTRRKEPFIAMLFHIKPYVLK